MIAALHVPVVDPDDPGAAVLATTSGTAPAQLDQALHLAMGGARQGDSSSVEIPLRLVRASLETGSVTDARRRLIELESTTPGDWRLKWYGGQCALLEGEFDKAAADFDAVLAMLPGELAPKLAIAATAELRDARDDALRFYETVWRTEHSYYSAAFGLARQRMRVGEPRQRDRGAGPGCLLVGALHRGALPPRSRSSWTVTPREPGRADAARCR